MSGRSRATVLRMADGALSARLRSGVERGATSSAQGRLLLARQRAQLPRWLAESHYNGPPRTDRTGALLEPLQPAWAAPSITADGARVVMEAYEPRIPVAVRRGEISVMAWGAGRGASALSHAAAGPQAQPYSAYNPVTSADGQRTVFETSAGNRTFAKRYGDTLVVAADARTGTTQVLSGDDVTAYAPTISADGSTAAFQAVTTSGPGAVSAAGGSPATRIHVRDLAGDRTEVVPARVGLEPALSGDARLVAYSDGRHVHVYDRDSGRTRRVSPAGGESWAPRPAADGSAVAFASTAGVRRRGDARVPVRDLATGRLRVASAVRGRALRGFASEPSISADGSRVAFSLAPRRALDAARGTGRQRQRVLVRDVARGTTVRVSPTRGYAGQPAISANGRRGVHRRRRRHGPARARGGGRRSRAVAGARRADVLRGRGRRRRRRRRRAGLPPAPAGLVSRAPGRRRA